MIDLQDLPVLRGTYALHLFVSHAQPISVGRLGQYHLPAGDYFYLGSARGAGGLQARVGRHLRGDGALHWHIDYLRAVAEVRDVLYTVTDRALECEWGQTLAQLPHAFIPIPHFGASDCRSGCAAHLIAFSERPDIIEAQSAVGQIAHAPIAHLRFP